MPLSHETAADTKARLTEVRQHLENACIEITKAICKLGFSEGQTELQKLHGLVYPALREAMFLLAVRTAHQNLIPKRQAA